MARSATTRRPADRRTGQPDRSAPRHHPVDDARLPPSGIGIAGDGALLPAATTAPDQEGQPVSIPDNPWAALSEADRQRFGRHFSRLLLLAVRSSARISAQEALR